MKKLQRLDTPVLFMDDDGTYRKFNQFTSQEKIIYVISAVVFLCVIVGLLIIAKSIFG